MAILEVEGIGVSAIASAVPREKFSNKSLSTYYGEDVTSQIIDKTGVLERREGGAEKCASDLCFAAAKHLLKAKEVNKAEIKILIFVSQTPDYRMPATSIILQERLELKTDTMALDVNLGCSGYVYGLSLAYSLLQSMGTGKALLLVGETRSRVYSKKDRTTAFLFGDAGTATLIEGSNEKFGKSIFSLNSDGSKESLIKIDAGGYRNPSSSTSVEEKIVDSHGNIRSMEQGYMIGSDVFTFVLKNVPKDIKLITSKYGIDFSDIDYFVLHQANKYMNDYLIHKLRIDPAKVPSSLKYFGNTSSASIPLTISCSLAGNLNCKILLSGFGVGMSWASMILELKNCLVLDTLEV